MLKTSSGQTAFAGLEKKLAGSVPDDSAIPGSVRRAVRLMLWGGAVTAVLGVFLVIATITDPSVVTGKNLSGSQLTGGVVYEIVVYLLLVTLWVGMARANRAGRGWARWIASVLAAISTFYTFNTVNSLKGGQAGPTYTVLDIVVIAGSIVTWLIGVLAVAMLWRSESSGYFRARAGVR
jgi:hypothetical protein